MQRQGPCLPQSICYWSGESYYGVLMPCIALAVLQVPNVTVAEINIELEFQMTFVLEYDASAGVWGAPRKAKMEMLHLDRTVRGNNVPLPRTLLRSGHSLLPLRPAVHACSGDLGSGCGLQSLPVFRRKSHKRQRA